MSLIPAHAVREWIALHDAIETAGDHAIPCRIGSPDRWTSRSTKQTDTAAAACQRCPAITACAAYADAAPETSGVWGGHRRTTTRPHKKENHA